MSYNGNNNSFFCYQIGMFNNNIKISVISFLLIFVSFYMNNVIVYGQQSDFSQLRINDDQDNDLNIVAVGDFYCNDETEDTVENIISINPELIITTGDHVKDVFSYGISYLPIIRFYCLINYLCYI